MGFTSIAICFLFLSRKNGVDIKGMNQFINEYYGQDKNLKEKEIKYFKSFALSWIDNMLNNNDFTSSLTSSFLSKREMIDKYLNF